MEIGFTAYLDVDSSSVRVISIFISLPKAGHGPWTSFLTSMDIQEAATIRSTSSNGCIVVNPTPFTPSWKTLIEFLDKHLK